MIKKLIDMYENGSITGYQLMMDGLQMLDPDSPDYQVSLEDNVPAPGFQTVTVRDTVPIGAGPRFMRMKVARP